MAGGHASKRQSEEGDECTDGQGDQECWELLSPLALGRAEENDVDLGKHYLCSKLLKCS